MKIVTSTTLWNDAVGKRMSITYSEIDEITGQIIADNKRIDRVITDTQIKSAIEEVMGYAQDFVDQLDN